jgi:hypothetical protein
VFGQGAVAGLTTYTGMLAGIMHLGLLVVTHGALSAPRVGNRPRRNGGESVAAIMSILPEALRHHCGSNNQENNYSRQEDQCGSDQVSGISEQTAQSLPPFVAAGLSASARARGALAG